MPVSNEVLAQGSGILMSTAFAATVAISGITAASPPVVTTAAAHGLVAGDYALIDGVTGPMGVVLNGVLAKINFLTTTTFSISGVTTVGMTPATAGSTSKATMIELELCKKVSLPMPATNDIDVTNLQSDAKEYRPGLRDFGELTIDYGINHNNAGFKAFFAAQASASARYFAIRLGQSASPHSFSTFYGYVKNFPIGEAGVDAGVTASGSIKVSGSVTIAVV